jgi:hypothetical protein
VCDLETSKLRRPRPELGCCVTENRYSKITLISLKYFDQSFIQIKKQAYLTGVVVQSIACSNNNLHALTYLRVVDMRL